MEKKPKTREVVRTIKEHTVIAAKDKAVQVGVKTKETVKEKTEEQFSPQQGRKQEQSPESYASDQVAEKSETVASEAAVVGEKAVKTTINKIREKRKEKKQAEEQTEDFSESPDADSSENPNQSSDTTPNTTKEKPADPSDSIDAGSKAPGPDSSNTETQTSDSANKPTKKTSGDQKKTESPSTERTHKPKEKTTSGKDKVDAPSQPRRGESDLRSTTQKKQADLSDPFISVEDPDVSHSPKTKEKTVKSANKERKTNLEPEKRVLHRKASEQTVIRERNRSVSKGAFQTEAETVEREITPRTKHKTPPKQRGQQTIKRVGVRNNEIRGIVSTPQRAKQVEHGAAQTIKTADKTVKKAERTAKAAKKAAEASAKAAKRSEEAARRTAKAAAQMTKVAIKASIEGIKATIAAAKELIAAAVAGSPAAIIIIIVICLIAAVGGTCFGIFLSNDEMTGTQYTMTDTISQLSAEHYNELSDLKSRYTYDTLETTGNMSINWKDVLAVYAVKTTTSTDNAYEVATMDDLKMDLLRQVISDMNQISCTVEPRQMTETVTEKDEYGNDMTRTRTVTKQILKVTVLQLTSEQIADQYGFNDEQKKQLSELLSPEYDELWESIIGTAGVVLTGNSTYIPTDIFAWPLMENGTRSSPFGYRTDPISGKTSFHGGTDISMPTGSPILAAADGVVVAAQWHDSYGNYVKIQHDGVFSTLYAHCSAIHVTVGQQVRQGEVIADVGATGRVTGAHLHFEVRINDQRVDAMQYYQ